MPSLKGGKPQQPNFYKVDLFEKVKKNKGPLGQYSKMAHGYYAFPKLEGDIAPRMKFRGKDVLTWSLNNSLGLGNHPEIPNGSTNDVG